ncbi:MAG: hypothetical protein KA059_00075 [Elusimicrobiales bacterium]|nr:hypothetical protein [Elusimicrobiales bacterium]
MISPSEFKWNITNEVNSILATKFTKQNINSIPNPDQIPLEGNHWLYVSNVTCVYADLVGSTQLQIYKTPLVAAQVYQIFVKSLVLTFDNFEAEYMDIKGDGAFAIFTGETAPILGLCAAVTFKTICSKVLSNKISGFSIKTHIGIDHKSILLKRIGLRGNKQNEVWAGKPVNMAAKLSSLSDPDTILTSDRVFSVFDSPKYQKYAVMSCGCTNEGPGHPPTNLWEEKDVSNFSYFDFPKAYCLKSNWCDVHGDEFCSKLISLAKKP